MRNLSLDTVGVTIAQKKTIHGTFWALTKVILPGARSLPERSQETISCRRKSLVSADPVYHPAGDTINV